MRFRCALNLGLVMSCVWSEFASLFLPLHCLSWRHDWSFRGPSWGSLGASRDNPWQRTCACKDTRSNPPDGLLQRFSEGRAGYFESGLLLGYVSDGFRGLLHGPSP